MQVSVIIPAFRHWDQAALCLQAMSEQTFPVDQFEIIVVNNDPSVPPPPGFDLPRNAQLIEQPKKGSYAARNAGLDAAQGGILCFTDADCKPDPDWIETAVRHLTDAEGSLRLGGPVDLFFKGDRLGWCEIYEKLTGFNQRRYVNELHWSATANMCTHAAAFDQVGLFDESEFSGGDSRWGRRAQAAGIPITFVEGLRVNHPSRATFAALDRKERRLTGGKVTKKLKRKGRARYIAHYLLTFPLKMLPSVSGVMLIQGLSTATRADRLKAIAFYLRLRHVRLIETGRLVLFGKSPENR